MSNELAAAFAEVVKKRRSIRAYKSEPASPDLLNEIFSLAGQSPSNCNTQPWQTHVASGAKIEVLRERMLANTMAGQMSMDYPYEPKYPEQYQERQFAAANALYSSMGIDRKDKARRNEVFLKNYAFFGAPHVAFFFIDDRFGLREAADIGMYAQTLMLSLSAHGLASVPQTSLGFHCDLVREVLGVQSNFKLIFGLSFGYEDEGVDINNAITERAALSETTYFHQ